MLGGLVAPAVVAQPAVAQPAAAQPATARPAAAQPSHAQPASATSVAPPDTVNDLLPEVENIGTCIGTLERPGCGSKAKGDFRQYLTFFLLFLGMSFIGWRITIGVRKRDREHTKPTGNTF